MGNLRYSRSPPPRLPALAVSLRLVDSSPLRPSTFAVPAAQPPHLRSSASIGGCLAVLAVFVVPRRASRATLAHPDSAPGPSHNAPGTIFACPRNFFRTPTRGRASRHPPRHAPLSLLPAHPGQRAPRTAKPRSNSEFVRRPRTGLVLVLASAFLLPARSGTARTRGDRRRVTGASATVAYEPRSRCPAAARNERRNLPCGSGTARTRGDRRPVASVLQCRRPSPTPSPRLAAASQQVTFASAAPPGASPEWARRIASPRTEAASRMPGTG